MNVLITAGPTREPMDPVRYLTNASSGAMGFALAEAFQRRGSRVTVVAGPTTQTLPKKIRLISVFTARQMNQRVQKLLPRTNVFIATAAVSDFRFEKTSATKLKKGNRQSWTIRLVRNPDVLKEAGRWRSKRRSNLILVGFALETGRIEPAMTTKLREKNLNLIIGNTPDSFAGSTIKPYWLERGKKVQRLSSMKKSALAKKIAGWAYGK